MSSETVTLNFLDGKYIVGSNIGTKPRVGFITVEIKISFKKKITRLIEPEIEYYNERNQK